MSDDLFYTSRRQFLGGGLTLLSTASTLPAFLGSAVRAMAEDAEDGLKKKSDSDPILVMIQLAGGNDGLNTIIPFGMDPYYQYRRQLAIPRKDVLPLRDDFGLHPAATGLKALFDDGMMSVIHGVGYPNPNRSHFTSMDIWHTADPNMQTHTGWLGRYFDAQCKGSEPAPEPIEAIALMEEAPLAMQGDRFAPMAFQNADALAWREPRGDDAAQALFRRLNNIDGVGTPVGSAANQFLQRASLQAQLGAEEIRSAGWGTRADRGRRRGRRGGGGGLTQQLNAVHNMIASDLPTRVYYVSFGGFDTHSGQLGAHQRLLGEFSSAVSSFVNDLKGDGLLDRVLIATFSEFGRRVQENASGGTDHGEAAPMFLFGSKLRPGLQGDHPDMRNLRRGDLRYTTDFRKVYAALLRDWMRVDYKNVLGPAFGPMRLLKRS
ncbi:MAG: DUF1501 domain-containing protein [Phycisphaerae bacterium]